MTQQRSIVGETLHRQFTVDKRSIDEEARTVEVAFASDTPVRRWFGDEVLVISAAAIRGGRLDDGAAVLVDHRSSDHVGVVESWSVSDKARAVLRFGRGARANDVFQDIADGIRRHVSVGYIVHSATLVKRGEEEVWEIDDWEPIEISIVAIPADTNVGVGRSADADTLPPSENGRDAAPVTTPRPTPGRSMEPKQTTEPAETEPTSAAAQQQRTEPSVASLPPATAGPDQSVEAERKRSVELLELGKRHGMIDEAREAIESNVSLRDFQAKILKRMESKPLSSRDAEIGLSERERKSYSFMRILRAMANPNDSSARHAAGFELECHEALVSAGRSAKNGGFLVPDDVLHQRAYSPLNTGTSGTNTGDTGGNLVATELHSESFIELLRNRSVLFGLATEMTGLVGVVDMPKQTAGTTATWIGEDEEAGETSLAIGQIKMEPHTCAAHSEITRRMLMQSSLDAEALLRMDLARATGLALDYAGFYGNPAVNVNQPRGVKFQTGIHTQDFSTGTAPTYAEIVGMESKIAASNADVESMAYVMGAAHRGALKTTQKFSGTNGAPVWEPNNTVNGYRAEVTNQIAAAEMFFGNWADLVIGLWGGFEMLVDPYTESRRGRLRVTVFQDADFAIRRAESFCLGAQPEE